MKKKNIIVFFFLFTKCVIAIFTLSTCIARLAYRLKLPARQLDTRNVGARLRRGPCFLLRFYTDRSGKRPKFRNQVHRLGGDAHPSTTVPETSTVARGLAPGAYGPQAISVVNAIPAPDVRFRSRVVFLIVPLIFSSAFMTARVPFSMCRAHRLGCRR